MYANVGTFERPTKGPGSNIWMNESKLATALDGLQWMSYYEGARAEVMLSGCPAGPQPGTGNWCVLDNMLTEARLGIASGVHTYLKNDTESQMPHMAAFLLARAENWYYFGSTGWWDKDFHWDALFDRASACGKPLEPPPASGAGTGPVYRRAFAHCNVSLDCTQLDFCKGNIDF